MDVFTGVLDRGPSDEFKRLMSVTDVQQADDLDEIHPEFWPGRVTIDIGGEKIERYAKHMLGEKERPMEMSGVHAKFQELAPNHADDVQQAVFDVVDDLENRTVGDLIAPLR
jgi:2-methylcitrate dehydratase PrpD